MQLITQFLGESVLITLLAALISLAFIELILPTYNEVLGKSLEVSYISTDLLDLFGLSLFVGVMGGLYPAFVLSNYRPATTLKSNRSAETKASVKFRNVLVVTQFSISIGLFISTAVIYSQMQYAQSMDLGYTKENLLIIRNAGELDAKIKQESIEKELRRHPQVTNVTRFTEILGRSGGHNTMVRANNAGSKEPVIISFRHTDYNFFKTYNIPLIAGRPYSESRNDVSPTIKEIRAGTTKTGKIIINQSAVKRLGFSSDTEALGANLFYRIALPPDETEMVMEIIGIIPDVIFDSLHSDIRPEIYFLQTDSAVLNTLAIRYTGNSSTLIRDAQALWKMEIPTVPFSYQFVDEIVALQYKTERGQAKVFAVFSGLAIVIACLGLYGLASFTAQRRTKEIGIRKVMGARVVDIVKLMLWQFSKPVILANIIAWPLTFYYTSKWLEAFTYRIGHGEILLLCLLGGVMALFISWATVISNTVGVAKTSPIKNLRYE